MADRDLIPPSPTYEGQTPPPDDAAFFALGEPIALFTEWLKDARAKEPNDSNAVALATCGADGAPDVRMVLLKDVDARGFTFYSNAQSAKGRELAENPNAALCFHWKSLRRQVRVRGPVEPVGDGEADRYFASRARDARIGAWASDQSRPMQGRLALEKRIAEYAAKFGLGEVPRPPHWIGWRVRPLQIEFWRDRPFRLHDRLEFRRAALDAAWTKSRLFP
ncbi:MAG: pyridoxamine 5'-phosphate oxidase [Alphaproteobacteria bacterium]|nr:pyridoxamine 5'-phosphate oxidase [Alphaproteobacteria bacterium]